MSRQLTCTEVCYMLKSSHSYSLHTHQQTPQAVGKNLRVRAVHLIFGTMYCFCITNISAPEAWSRDSSVGITTGYGLGDRGVGVRVLVGSRIYLLHVVQSGFVVHPTSYPIGTGGSVPGVKRPVRETDHSPAACVEVKKMWIYTSTPLYGFMA
jgi:hypothetical protein